MEIVQLGRMFWMVKSASRRTLWHYIDLEPNEGDGSFPRKGIFPYTCTCEAHYFNSGEICKHIRAIMETVTPALDLIDQTKKYRPSQKRTYTLNPNRKYEASKTTQQSRLSTRLNRNPA